MDPPAAEPGLGDHKAVAALAKEMVLGDPHVFVADVRVGAEIVGVTVHRHVADDVDARRVEPALARHQTSHNSGVVHAGLYYAPGSLKARLCRRGLALLRDYCAERGLPYNACGKLVVAKDEREVEPLRRLSDGLRPTASRGSGGSRRVTSPRSSRTCAGSRAHSPETAIADFAAVARAFAAEVTAAGGEIRLCAPAARVDRNGGRRPRVELRDGGVVEGDRVIVCAGLQADRLAVASGEPAEPRIVPFRGEYWQLRADRSISSGG